MDKLSERTKNLVGWVCVGIVALAILVGLIYAAWRGMLLVPPNTARAWALAVTVLLPLTGWGAFKVGTWYARGIVQGIDWGIGKVAQAGSNAADLRVHVHREMRRPAPESSPAIVLPDVEIVPRQLSSGGDILEL